MKSTLLVLSLLLFVCYPHHGFAQQVSSVEFNQAVDAAMSNLVASISFQNYINEVISFPVPTCAFSTAYPRTNPIPRGVTTLKMCYDGASYISEPWPSIYKTVGNGIVQRLNSQYKLQLTATFVLINTENGYFSSLKKAVDSGECDIAVADTTLTDERSSQVHFSKCPYGSTANGFLRNDLDNSTVKISTFSDLNNSTVKVTFFKGTIFETIANQSLPLSQKIPSSYDGQFDLISKRQVHVVIADGLDLLEWKLRNANDCPQCFVRIFGDSAPFGVFTQLTARSSDISSILPSSSILIMLFGFLFLLL